MASFNGTQGTVDPRCGYIRSDQGTGPNGCACAPMSWPVLTDPSPAVELGIYRILIALIIDAYDVHRYRQLVNLLWAGRFDIDALDQYVSSVGECRFDLFDSDYPFLQISEEAADGLSREPVSRLLQHIPSGSFWLHFHHQRSDLQAFSPAVCARALSTVAPFMTAGGAGHSPSINGAPPWYVLVLGNNLFETLVLNCCVMIILGQEGDAPPAWSGEDHAGREGAHVTVKSICEGYTWRPRSIRFISSQCQCTYTGAQSDVLVWRWRIASGPCSGVIGRTLQLHISLTNGDRLP